MPSLNQGGINAGLHTSYEDCCLRIMLALQRAGVTCSANAKRNGLLVSTLGEAAFQGYRFRTSQGAALAVSKILSRMKKEGIIGNYYYYYITPEGHEWLSKNT